MSSQVRRQLEYTIAEEKGIKLVKPPSTSQAVVDIVRTRGLRALYNGFPLHLRQCLLTSQKPLKSY